MTIGFVFGLVASAAAGVCAEPAVPAVPAAIESQAAYEQLKTELRDYNTASYDYTFCVMEGMEDPSTTQAELQAISAELSSHEARRTAYKSAAKALLLSYQS